LRDVRVVVMDVSAARLQEANNLEGRGFAGVTDIWLVGDADDKYPGPLDALLSVVESVHNFRDYVLGHVAVDLPSEFDESRLETIRSCLPGQVEGVYRDAVAAETGSRIERHEAEGFRGGSVNDLPNIQIEPVAHESQLVHQTDIHTPKCVLQELDHFRSPRR
jgi:hypothetical protein